MKPKILFIEDDLSLQKSISYILEKEGFTVLSADSGEDGVDIALKEKPDLILLDIMLPGMDGYRVCEILKKNPVTSDGFIVMLSGKGQVQDITRGLCEYADDYITKPFEPAILIARIQAVLRRKPDGKTGNHNILHYRDIVINIDERVLHVNNQPVPLTKTEFDLLVLLASNPNIVFNRSQILDHIRQNDLDLTERVVDYQVSGLRKKLSSTCDCIETVRGIGYKFKA